MTTAAPAAASRSALPGLLAYPMQATPAATHASTSVTESPMKMAPAAGTPRSDNAFSSRYGFGFISEGSADTRALTADTQPSRLCRVRYSRTAHAELLLTTASFQPRAARLRIASWPPGVGTALMA